MAQNHACTGIEEIGHDDLDSLRPKVAPFFGKHNRDIAQLMQLGVAHKDPIILPSPIGLVGGSTTIERFREVLDQIAYVSAVGKLACARHCKNIGPLEVLNELEREIGGVTGISDDYDLTHPGRGREVLQHLTDQDVLMALTLRIDCGNGNRDTKMVLARH